MDDLNDDLNDGASRGGWGELAGFLASLPDEERELFARYAALDLPASPADEAAIATILAGYSRANPDDTPAGLLATTGAQAGFAGAAAFARRVGRAALELAGSADERALAHVSLAQTHFQSRREESELELFETHCRAAIREGHSGTFCYERLAVLYEYRGRLDEAELVCRRAVEALAGEDPRSAQRFRQRLERLSAR